MIPETSTFKTMPNTAVENTMTLLRRDRLQLRAHRSAGLGRAYSANELVLGMAD